MGNIRNYLRGESVAVVSQDTTSLTLTFINIIPTTSTSTLLKSGDKVYIICADTGSSIELTLDADISYNSTRITFASTTVSQLIPGGSVVILDRENKYDSLFRDYTIVTHKLFEVGNTHANTNLINPQYPTDISINAGAVWADGDTISNEATVFNIFRAPHNGCKIERITWDINTDSTTGHNGVFELWQKRITENGNNASLISLVDSFAFTSQNDVNYVFNRDVQLTKTLTDSECLIPTFRKTGSTSSSDKFYATLTLLISTDPRQ
jgi:hypothetical protein